MKRRKNKNENVRSSLCRLSVSSPVLPPRARLLRPRTPAPGVPYSKPASYQEVLSDGKGEILLSNVIVSLSVPFTESVSSILSGEVSGLPNGIVPKIE